MSILSDEQKGSPINAEYSSFGAGPAAVLRCRLRFGYLLRSSLESVSLPGDVPCLKDTCHERALPLKDFNSFRWSFNAFPATPWMGLKFFNRNETGISDSQASGQQQSRIYIRDSFGKKPRSTWTDKLIFANILVRFIQFVSDEDLTKWGSKNNRGIKKGQLWRLVTYAFLHDNFWHLVLNWYSLRKVGPAIENIWGPEKYITIYLGSAVAGSTMSYWYNKKHSIGATGAICGPVGSYFAYRRRNEEMTQETDDHLKQIRNVFIINLIFGSVNPSIDHWAHLGGFIGGAAVAYLVGQPRCQRCDERGPQSQRGRCSHCQRCDHPRGLRVVPIVNNVTIGKDSDVEREE